eukprot:scaffold6450_cov147-Skeletonema_dohrnii-CCMP3373.AAC.3
MSFEFERRRLLQFRRVSEENVSKSAHHGFSGFSIPLERTICKGKTCAHHLRSRDCNSSQLIIFHINSKIIIEEVSDRRSDRSCFRMLVSDDLHCKTEKYLLVCCFNSNRAVLLLASTYISITIDVSMARRHEVSTYSLARCVS